MSKFTLSNCIKNLGRYRSRYLPFGILIAVLSAVIAATLVTAAQANAVVKEYRAYYAPEGYYIADEDVEAVGLSVSKDEVIAAEKLYMLTSRLCVLSAVTAAAFTVYIALSTVNARLYETAVIYALGTPMRRIFLSLACEMLLFMLISFAAGGLSGIVIGVATAMEKLPSDRLTFTGAEALILIPAAVSVLIPIVILYAKIQKCSPCRLLKEEM